MELIPLKAYPCEIIRQNTPDGVLWLFVVEDDSGKPIRMTFEIGKSGASIRAWCDALSRVACLLLDKGGTIEQIMAELSNITTDKSVVDTVTEHLTTRAWSGPEGICKAIAKYKDRRYKRFLAEHNENSPEVGTFLERE